MDANISASSGGCRQRRSNISNNGDTSIKTLTGTGGQVNLGTHTLLVTAAVGTFSGTLGGIGDTGGFTVSGGTQTFNAVAGNYTGGTGIGPSASLLLTGATNIAASSVTDNGTFDISGNGNTTIASLKGGGHVNLGANTLTTGNDNSSTTFSGAIGGTGGLTKEGTGAFTLSGVNTYNGGTSILAGTVVVGNNSAFGTGPVAMAAGTTMSFLNTGNFTVANNIQISGDPTFTPPKGTIQALSGVISDGTSPGTLVLDGAGTLVLSAVNTYTAPTIINSGTLDVTGSIAFSNLTVNNGTTLSGTGIVGNTQINGAGTFAPGSGRPARR